MSNEPKRLTPADITRWKRKDVWTIYETAYLLCGYAPPEDLRAERSTPSDVREAAEDVGRARIAGHLRTVGPEDDNGRKYMLRQRDVIAWAASAHPEFLRTDTPAAQSPHTDQLPAIPKRPKPMSEQHAEAVLAAICAAGYNPTALPPRVNGKRGVKAEIKERCNSMTPAAFDHTWKKLCSAGKIRERR